MNRSGRALRFCPVLLCDPFNSNVSGLHTPWRPRKGTLGGGFMQRRGAASKRYKKPACTVASCSICQPKSPTSWHQRSQHSVVISRQA